MYRPIMLSVIDKWLLLLSAFCDHADYWSFVQLIVLTPS